MNIIFSFHEINFENTIHIPSFNLRNNDLVCISVPDSDSNIRRKLMIYLSKNNDNKAYNKKKTSTIPESSHLYMSHNTPRKTVKDYLRMYDILDEDCETITLNMECTCNTLFSNISLNELLLVNIRTSLLKGSEIIIYTTCGHDPSGVIISSNELLEKKKTGIDVISSSILPYYKSLGIYNKFIECDYLQ